MPAVSSPLALASTSWQHTNRKRAAYAVLRRAHTRPVHTLRADRTGDGLHGLLLLHRFERLLGRPVEDGAVYVKARAVAGAVPT